MPVRIDLEDDPSPEAPTARRSPQMAFLVHHESTGSETWASLREGIKHRFRAVGSKFENGARPVSALSYSRRAVDVARPIQNHSGGRVATIVLTVESIEHLESTGVRNSEGGEQSQRRCAQQDANVASRDETHR